MDLTSFVVAELDVIKRLKLLEEKRGEEEGARREKRREKALRGAAGDFADRVLEQNRQMIVKYPDMFIDERASFEMRKLFGALDVFDKEHWPHLDRVLRKLFPSSYANPRLALEPRLYSLCSGAAHQPPGLSRYQSLLMRFPQSQKEIEWEEKRLVLEGAFLLHQVSDVIAQIEGMAIEEEDRPGVEKTAEYVHILLADFRLKDLKPSKQGA